MDNEKYEVKLDSFEGPMDLLVHLIRKAEVDIYDIPIALITDQFLAYIEWMKAMNIDFAGDFLVMAATLMQIKSKMLLPVHDDGEEEEEDPRMEIARPLREYLQIKAAAEELSTRTLLGEHTFVRSSQPEAIPKDEEPELVKVGLFELIDAFQKILENLNLEKAFALTADRISVKDRITQIIDILEARGSVTFTELFDGAVDKSDFVVTFLSILEMAKLNLIQIAQHMPTGVIRLFYL